MNVFILTAGSRGDVQPYVALGMGLERAGHAVTVCTCASFESLITTHGLSYGYMNDGLLKLVDSEAGRRAMEGGDNIFGLLRSMVTLLREAKSLNRSMLHDSWAAAQAARPDIVVFHPKAMAGAHIAEKLQVPAAMAVPIPIIVPTAEFAAVGFPRLLRAGWYNRLSHRLLHKGYHQYDDVVNEFRQSVLGLGALPKSTPPIQMADGTPISVLHGFSELVWPRPADWPGSAHITGYWFLELGADWEPPAELEAFLEAGPPPVYVGFGSMAGRNPRRLAGIVVEALQQAGVRGVLATGWGGLDVATLPDSILQVEDVPHAWLFPRVAAVVHHGGAGTTAAGLRAGRPTVICPFMVDQPLWGERVHALGAGSRPMRQKKLTAAQLAGAIREVTASESIRRRARALGEQLRAEDGVGNAVAILERIDADTHRRRPS